MYEDAWQLVLKSSDAEIMAKYELARQHYQIAPSDMATIERLQQAELVVINNAPRPLIKVLEGILEIQAQFKQSPTLGIKSNSQDICTPPTYLTAGQDTTR